jgi:hypothetical protein
MRMLAALLALSTVLAGAIAPAEAAPPRVAAYDCGALAAQKGPGNVWQTWFSGRRDELFGPDSFYTAAPCFTTQANCKAWLYWAQSDWQKYSTFRPCRKGLSY